MKHLKSLLALAMFSFLLVSCTQDNEATDASLDLTAQISTSAKDQVPNSQFNTTSEGVYHGIFSSGMAQSRGKIWINIGNDGNYNALIELVDAGSYTFELATNASQDSNPDILKFVNPNGSFVINITDPDSPVITNATLNNLVHLSRVLKSTSNRVPTFYTGTFAQTSGPLSLSGTWDLAADGSGPNPNGNDPASEAITEVIVTYVPAGGAIMKTDTTFELFAECLLGPGLIPQTGGFGPTDILAGTQTSDFGGAGMTDWNLVFIPLLGGYYTGCALVATGTWSRDGGINAGTILIDP